MSIIKPEPGGAYEHGPVVVVHRGGGGGGGGGGEEERGQQQQQRREVGERARGPRGLRVPDAGRHAPSAPARGRAGRGSGGSCCCRSGISREVELRRGRRPRRDAELPNTAR